MYDVSQMNVIPVRPFFVGKALEHADVLFADSVKLATSRGVPVVVTKLPPSDVELRFEDGRRVVASDWDNLRSALLA